MSQDEREILQSSKYMDTLAKIIIAKRNVNKGNDANKNNNNRSTSGNVSIIQEYKDKLNKLDSLLNLILQLEELKVDSNNSQNANSSDHQWKLDKEKLAQTFDNGKNVEIIEKDEQKYLLIPVKEESLKQKRNKYKQKKKTCSSCHEVGHSKANCPKKLFGGNIMP